MAGRPKAEWLARVRSIGRALRQGEGICVHVRIALDREPLRDVSIYMSLPDARKWREALDIMIKRTEVEQGVEYCEYDNCPNMLSPDKSVDYCYACGRKQKSRECN